MAVCWVRSPIQFRSVLGENCELASWTATSIIDNSRVIEVISPPAIAVRIERALSTVVDRAVGKSSSSSDASSRNVNCENAIAAITNTTGKKSRRCLSRSRS